MSQVKEIKDNMYTLPCLLCPELFPATDNGMKNPILGHMLKSHKLVIANVQHISKFPRYINHWRRRFKEEALSNFCTLIKTNTDANDKEPQEDFYLLSDFLPEDRAIREQLKLESIETMLAEQQEERKNPNFVRRCLFCKTEFKGNRALLFEHMAKDHGFNIGNPDNMIHANELLDHLQRNLDDFVCLFCEKKFESAPVLKEHMRKKNHKRIDPKNKAYDKYYLINYLDPGKDWKDVQAEEDCMEQDNGYGEVEDWSDWVEEEAEEVKCLFCDTKTTRGVQYILEHMQKDHQFNLTKVRSENGLDFYQQVKVVNYIRKKVDQCACPSCLELCETSDALTAHLTSKGHCLLPKDKSAWDRPEYFFTTLENDPLLYFLEDDEVLEEDLLPDYSQREMTLSGPEL